MRFRRTLNIHERLLSMQLASIILKCCYWLTFLLGQGFITRFERQPTVETIIIIVARLEIYPTAKYSDYVIL